MSSQWLFAQYCIQSMQREKPPKLDVRHFKNSLISSRNQSQHPPQSALANLLASTARFRETNTSTCEAVSKRGTLVTSNSVDGSRSSSHKRLKLKDYLHLNDLEKRNKSKSKSNSASRETGATLEKHQDNELEKLKISNIDLQGQPSIALKKTAEKNYSIMIKDEITSKIKEERKRLEDLETYLQSDFNCKEDMTQTFVFLFSIYNKMIDIRKISDNIGGQIIDYDRKEQSTPASRNSISNNTPKITKKVSYHWEDSNKELDSPAKIMKNALKMTFDLTKMLNITK